MSHGTVKVELNHHAAQLLASLCAELGTDDPSAVISRALGVLEMCMRTRRQGGSLQFVNERGETAEVVF